MRKAFLGLSIAAMMVAGMPTAMVAQPRNRTIGGPPFGVPGLPPCGRRTPLWPPLCRPDGPVLDGEFRNSQAEAGSLHYEIVRQVLTRLAALPAEGRTAETARRIMLDYAASRRMRVDPSLLNRPPGDAAAALRAFRASPRLTEGVMRASELAERMLPIPEFLRGLDELDRAADVVLEGRERIAFHTFSATLAAGYRFWAPGSEGGSGGAELLFALGTAGPATEAGGTPSAARRPTRTFWRNLIRIALTDAAGTFDGLGGGVASAVIAGADDSVRAGLGLLGP